MTTNLEYHANRTHLTSSMLKLILKSADEFNKTWNLGQHKESDKEVFQEGSLTHSLILEPHLVQAEYAFFQGLRRIGKDYDLFKTDNPGKRIFTEAQRIRAHNYTQAYKMRSEAVALITGGEAEFTVEGDVLDVPCKARFDYINYDKGYLVDIKTTGMPSGPEIFKDAVNQFRYDLSAALYLMLAELRYKKSFDWYFIVISKCDKSCDVYKLSEETRRAGVAFVFEALTKYKRCKQANSWVDNPPVIEDNGTYLIEEV